MLRMFCFYYDEVHQSYYGTSFWEMKAIKGTTEFLRRKSNLYKDERGKTKMQIVTKGLHQGFRRYPIGAGNPTCLCRGDNESVSHQGNKEAIASLKEIKLNIGCERVIIYVRNIELEKEVTCNNRNYEIDIYIEIERTEPKEYKEMWNGELWVEVFHTCKVDRQQAEDFAIEGLPLFETKIPNNYTFYENISLEGYKKRKEQIIKKYKQFGVAGMLFLFNNKFNSAKWRLSENGNYTAYIGNRNFTIIRSKYDEGYGIIYGEKKPLWEYNGKRFCSIEEAKNNAEYLAFLLYNNEKV